MSHALLKAQVDSIVADFHPTLWQPVCDEAREILRETITLRVGGRYVDWTYCWLEATEQDFAAAAERLKAAFTETTGERVLELASFRGATQVSLRPTAIWMDGKTYRARLARMWSYSPHEGEDLRWAAELTPFGRLAGGLYRYHSTDRKRTDLDAPSEHLAAKGMKEIFEKVYRIGFAA